MYLHIIEVIDSYNIHSGRHFPNSLFTCINELYTFNAYTIMYKTKDDLVCNSDWR